MLLYFVVSARISPLILYENALSKSIYLNLKLKRIIELRLKDYL